MTIPREWKYGSRVICISDCRLDGVFIQAGTVSTISRSASAYKGGMSPVRFTLDGRLELYCKEQDIDFLFAQENLINHEIEEPVPRMWIYDSKIECAKDCHVLRMFIPKGTIVSITRDVKNDRVPVRMKMENPSLMVTRFFLCERALDVQFARGNFVNIVKHERLESCFTSSHWKTGDKIAFMEDMQLDQNPHAFFAGQDATITGVDYYLGVTLDLGGVLGSFRTAALDAALAAGKIRVCPPATPTRPDWKPGDIIEFLETTQLDHPHRSFFAGQKVVVMTVGFHKAYGDKRIGLSGNSLYDNVGIDSRALDSALAAGKIRVTPIAGPPPKAIESKPVNPHDFSPYITKNQIRCTNCGTVKTEASEKSSCEDLVDENGNRKPFAPHSYADMREGQVSTWGVPTPTDDKAAARKIRREARELSEDILRRIEWGLMR